MPSGPFYEPGRYWGRVTRQKLGAASTGTPQFVLTFEVIGKVNPADPGGDLQSVSQSYERSVFRAITDKTIDYVMDDLAALGFNGESFAVLDEDHPGCCNFRGKEFAFGCDHEERKVQRDGVWEGTGEMRERWSIVRESTGPVIKPLEKKEVRQLDAMFGRALKERAKAPAVETPAPETQPEAAVSQVAKVVNTEVPAGEDIPF